MDGRWFVIAAAVGLSLGPRSANADPSVQPVPRVADGSDSFDRTAMVRELTRRGGGDPAAAAQLVQLTRGMEPALSAEMFEQLAKAHQAAGAVDLAADARLQLVQNYTAEPGAAHALVWLTRLYASSEAAQQHRAAGQPRTEETEQGPAMYAYHLAEGIEGTAEVQAGDPPLVFARAVAARRAGMAKASSGLISSLKHSRTAEAWGACAHMESWLVEGRQGQPPVGVAECRRAAAPPRLDGVLDEDFWRREGDPAPTERPAAADPNRTIIRWACDEEYLYVAGRVGKQPTSMYTQDHRPRVRDAALARDRVRLLVDVDRDYATAFELTVDCRGWTADACWGDAAWNPEWFVAAGPGNGDPQLGEWTFEAAIALAELGATPAPGAAWAVSVQRMVPTPDGETAPSAGAADLDPSAFRILLFP